MDEQVCHLLVYHRKDGLLDLGGGPTFHSLVDLMEHYKNIAIVTVSGTVIELKHPYHTTSFLPSSIAQHVGELQKKHMAGFREEFEVRL